MPAKPSIPAPLKHLPELYNSLAKRMGYDTLDQRLHRQKLIENKHSLKSKNLIHPDNIPGFFHIVTIILKATGLWGRGYREFLDVEVVENTVTFPNLPLELDGFRLLQLSDLHIDVDPALASAIISKLEGLQYDAAVITGDFRNEVRGSITACMEHTRPIVEALKAPKFGILGNHDTIEKVPILEDMGLPILLNETTCIRHNDAPLYISGIDDPHTYEGHDFDKLRGTVPENAFSILLSHAPETFHEAEALGYDFVIGGHTHAGQICLPGGITLIHNGACPRRMLQGNWEYGTLKGYTNRGTGACILPIRLFCRGEITVHTLRRQTPS